MSKVLLSFESDVDRVRDDKLVNIGLFLNNTNLEGWMKEQLKGNALVNQVYIGKKDNYSEIADDIDAAIILRKTRDAGVLDPEDVLKNIPGTEHVLFIVGTLDDEGKKQIDKLKKHVKHLYLSYNPRGQMSETDLRKGLQELLDGWRRSQTNLYHFTGSKGGCGTTSVVVQLANYLTAQNKKVKIISASDSFSYFQCSGEVSQMSGLITSIIHDFEKMYDYILVDNVPLDEDILARRICVIDGSPESIGNAKELASRRQIDKIVYNFACCEMPTELVAKETNIEVCLTIPLDRPLFLQSAVTGEVIVPNIETLLE